ncbi:glycosyltransferase family 2 protein [Alicyclobacillus sp. SO9]|uniref:glycosyltransferase family 2 protein n=1 Tax=Alicyclobacillus sp. SO9 TaxID=2665646 RepID=UPI0018E6E027|nr:glycosyltransferase family 2 protein [Alicyclobacillus sp. SO9]QQE79060.1 glycosyltransferase family 2 protein [Alicyclobacillus sp. SO9]
MKLVTLIIPAYNEQDVLYKLYDRLNQVMNDIKSRYDCEYLFVNDGSNDNTMRIIKELRESDNRISYVDLSRNFGKEVAMIAGMDYAKGDAVVIMDADLQHPPEVIPEMLGYWEQGYEDVYATRVHREGESWLRRFTSKKYYELLQKTTKMPIYPNAGDFRLLDRRCVTAIRQMREAHRYTKGMYGWIGFKKKEIEYVASPRDAGETKWSYLSLFNLAIEGLTSSTTIPLRVSSFLGFGVSFLALFYTIFVVIQTVIYGSPVSGYPTLVVSILFLGGIQLISIGIIGEYLGRIFIETKKRPLYFIEEYNDEKILPYQQEQ